MDICNDINNLAICTKHLRYNVYNTPRFINEFKRNIQNTFSDIKDIVFIQEQSGGWCIKVNTENQHLDWTSYEVEHMIIKALSNTLRVLDNKYFNSSDIYTNVSIVGHSDFIVFI